MSYNYPIKKVFTIFIGLDSSFLHKVESTKNGKRKVNRQRSTLKRERSTTPSAAVNSPQLQIRRKSAATVATQTPVRIRRQKSVNIPPSSPRPKSAKSPRIRRQYTVDSHSYHHIRRKSSTKCIEGEIILKK